MKIDNLPSAFTVTAMPHQSLPRLLHCQRHGAARPFRNASYLADTITAGEVMVDDVILDWRPFPDQPQIDAILRDERDSNESPDHRRLKVHARIIALAVDPLARLEPEAPASHERFPRRADLLAWSRFGFSRSYECGATDGRSILTQLLHGQLQVTALPYAGLTLPIIRGYAFRLAGNPPLPPRSGPEAEAAWQQLLREAATAPAFRLAA